MRRPKQRMQGLRTELDTLNALLDKVAQAFYSDRVATLDNAQHRMARARAAVPTPDDLELPANNSRPRRHGSSAPAPMSSTLSRRDGGPRGRARRPAILDDLRVRLVAARDHARRKAANFENAFDRIGAEAERTLGRRLREREREVAQTRAELSSAAQRRLEAARTQLNHAVELVQAKDFRRRGYALVADKEGRPVRSAAALNAGDDAALRFHDGAAEVSVRSVTIDEGEANA